MLSLCFQELRTNRLLLRKIRPEDAPLFFSRLGGSEEVTAHMLWNPHTCVEESAASIQKALHRYETGEACRWVLELGSTGELIGIIDLLPRDRETGEATFAYMLGKDFWGKGYGTEALDAVISHAFRKCGAVRISADHFGANPASGALMRKAGMQYQGTVPRKYEKNGIFYDAPQYAITKEQWMRKSQ